MKRIVRRVIDIGMMACLLLLMPYSLLSEHGHEWIGMGMFTLVIIHQILNRMWWKTAVKRKYTAVTGVQTVLVILLVMSMLGSMVTGIYMSRYVFANLLPYGRDTYLAARIHMFCAYFGFMIMGIHCGYHLHVFFPARKGKEFSKRVSQSVLAAAAIAGIFASLQRGFWNYFFLRNHFFAEFGTTLLQYLVSYLFIEMLFVFLGTVLSGIMIRYTQRYALQKAGEIRKTKNIIYEQDA